MHIHRWSRPDFKEWSWCRISKGKLSTNLKRRCSCEVTSWSICSDKLVRKITRWTWGVPRTIRANFIGSIDPHSTLLSSSLTQSNKWLSGTRCRRRHYREVSSCDWSREKSIHITKQDSTSRLIYLRTCYISDWIILCEIIWIPSYLGCSWPCRNTWTSNTESASCIDIARSPLNIESKLRTCGIDSNAWSIFE